MARQLDLLAPPAPSKPGPMRHHTSATTRHRASVRSRLDEWSRDRGEFDPIGLASGDRGLTGPERMRAIRFARRNYKRNGLYGAIINKLVEHTIGDGVELEFKDKEVRAYVLGILGDRRNRFFKSLEDLWRDTLNEGEYLRTIETQRLNPRETGPVPTGIVRFGRFEIEQIRDIKVSANEPTEIEIELEAGLRQWFPVATPGRLPAQEATVVHGEVVTSGTMTAIDYWSVARLAGRGTPKLLRILEKAELVDDVVDANARKAEYLNRFWLHGEYESGFDDEADEKFADEVRAYMDEGVPGASLLTAKSRGFTMSVFAPDLKVLDQKELFDQVIEFVLGSEGIPRMWFASSGETNRATAVEQGSPIHRMLVSLQSRLQDLVNGLIEYLVWLGKASGRVRADADETFTVAMASISTRDTQRELGALQQLQSLLQSAVESGKLHPEEAQQIFRSAIRAQTMFEVKLQDEPPDPSQVRRVADVLNEMPENLREAVRTHLPGHRRTPKETYA